MAKQSVEVTKLMKHFKEVGFHFAKEMKKMLNDGSMKPPKGYSVGEYTELIDIAYEEGVLRSAENSNKKNKQVNEATTKKPTDEEHSS